METVEFTVVQLGATMVEIFPPDENRAHLLRRFFPDAVLAWSKSNGALCARMSPMDLFAAPALSARSIAFEVSDESPPE